MNCSIHNLAGICLFFAAGYCAGAQKNDLPDAESLISHVSAEYRATSAYESTGAATIHVLRPEDGTETTSEVQFGILLARPRYYRIAWTQQTASGSATIGATWNSGGGPKLYDSTLGGYTRLESDELAFSEPAGTSLGVTQVLPDVFFDAAGGPLGKLGDMVVEGVDMQGNIPCYALAGRLESGVNYHLWIATNTLHIVKLESALGGASEQAVLEATPERKRELLRAMGKEDTEENIAYLDEALAKARSLMQNVRGTSRQFHAGIRTGFATVPDDFEYAMPVGTIDLTEERLSGNDPVGDAVGKESSP